VSLGDRAADREAHANPIGLGRVKGLEQSVEFLRIEPGAGVLHFDDYAVRIVYAETIVSSRGPSLAPAIASMALMIRLIITCCS
jgi:hypothetical protein